MNQLLRVLRRARLPAACLVAACLTGCDDRVAPPLLDGQFAVTLEAPAGHVDGAALIELRGAGIVDVQSDGARLWSEVTADGARVLLVARTPGQLRFSVRLSQASAAPTATVLQVSDAANELRPSVQGYAVSFWQ